ncbi:MAG: 60S ribosomal export protein NMD3 [Methanobacteriota archaeon]
MFCVECGREASDLHRGLCGECFSKKTPVFALPDRVHVAVCAHCGSVKRPRGWTDTPLPVVGLLEEAAREETRVRPEAEDARVEATARALDRHNHEVAISATGTVFGFPVRAEATIPGMVRRETCTRCSRIHGGYYEAIVQLRRPGGLAKGDREVATRIVSDHAEGLQRRGDREGFLLRIEEVHDGLDYYYGTIDAGRAVSKSLAESLGGRLRESPKLVGRKEGQDLYRITYGVKLPAYHPGSLLRVGDGLFSVRGVSPRRVTLTDLSTHEVVVVDREAADEARIVDAEPEEAVVVSESEREIQVLDPVTFRTRDLVKPPGFSARGGTVRVVRWEDGLRLLPNPETPPRREEKNL